MLSSTFLHLRGVGPLSEAKLWKRGIVSWELLAEALGHGTPPRALLRDAPAKGQLRFPVVATAADSSAASMWLEALDAAKSALAHSEFAYFAEHLPTPAHWRILPHAINDALYLDIETTGLSKDLHALTVIGALYRDRFYQWTWSEGVDQLAELISDAPLVVTFNGARFDLPFLRKHLPFLPLPRAHVDLRSISHHAGYKGGLKSVEEQLGLTRQKMLQGVGGEEAAALWCSTLYGDRAAYRTLLAYNKADVLMLRSIALLLSRQLAHGLAIPRARTGSLRRHVQLGREAAAFEQVQSEWQKGHATVSALAPGLRSRFARMPVVVGIDLRGKAHNPTGLAACVGSRVEHAIAYEDEEILAWTLRHAPDLVSIDAPLSLPRGRKTPYDDDPTRRAFGIVRAAERILWARGIRVYPALIRNMQGLTARGIFLKERLERVGVQVIESYPGAAQDVLGIPRKGVGLDLLARGLQDFGFDLPGNLSHDELDAVTSALVGYFFLADKYEGLGSPEENFMIVPRPNTLRWHYEPLRGAWCA